MIISEKQIMWLINKCKDYSVLLSLSNLDSAKDQYNSIRDLLDSIANQQSEELNNITSSTQEDNMLMSPPFEGEIKALVSCEHIEDAMNYLTYPVAYKCKKYGEFYR